ncbi:type II toxin-antitoxin system VapC family toxin [Pseudonocardia nigra]|uniref:type II toxin-antitoxin system VapC family toxin n=1 Tax=Pseudonocardia nigra TaxID=1921578 RepID=UPI001C5D4720|nr:type II toxin-antitoxin system VapC family toxin [Pseudonocardia nigra]
MIDASALVELATGRKPEHDLTRRVRTGAGAAPELIDIETLHVLRSMHRRGSLDAAQAAQAVGQVEQAPLARMAHRPLVSRIWELRDSITAYDAAYIALAERLDVPLLTCDARLGRAHGHGAEVIVYPRS